MVTVPNPRSPSLQSSFCECAQARGILVDPARVRRPRDKGRVENAVPYVRERWADGERFLELGDSRRSSALWCRDVAGQRVHGTTRAVPLTVFEAEEKAHLLPPPQERFDVPMWGMAKVHPDQHLQVARSLYSVPTAYIGRQLDYRLFSKEAGLDPDMLVKRWDKTAKVQFDKRVFQELCSLRFADDARNVIVLGPVGVGKTFLASALGHLACKGGYNVRFHRADALLRRLRQSRLDNSRDGLMAELIAVGLLIIDDFALESMTRVESRDVYQLFVERPGRAATVVTSNRDTAEWLNTFDDALLAQSAVDRFKNAAYDLVIEGESYRPRQKPTVDKAGPPPDRLVEKRQVHPRHRGRR